MIEKIILDYLNEKLDVDVYLEKPIKAPARYVLLEKTGSSRENYINYSTVAIQSYAESMYEAASLNETVKKAMDEIIMLPAVLGSKLNSDYNFTDTTKKGYRYQAIYDLVF